MNILRIAFFLTLVLSTVAATAADRPNFVVIFIDDMGYGVLAQGISPPVRGGGMHRPKE